MLAHPSTELVARAPCQLRHSRARAPASSAALRSTSRTSATFKRGAPQGALDTRARFTLAILTPYFTFFLGVVGFSNSS